MNNCLGYFGYKLARDQNQNKVIGFMVAKKFRYILKCTLLPKIYFQPVIQPIIAQQVVKSCATDKCSRQYLNVILSFMDRPHTVLQEN